MEEMNDTTQEENSINKKDKYYFYRYIVIIVKRFVSLHLDIDSKATIQRIEEGIEFRGSNVWLLIFAIFIASLGLNVNSTAVIIGAMLISPLMGPIMGVGLAVGINDNKMLSRSLQNFGAMVLISIMTSTLYFIISPLSDAQSELLARTQPTIYDVLIAFFGGLANSVAHSRKGEKITIISGVAIATALMPPLCTAGYAIATGQMRFFIGASYLFFINSFFIALATVLMSYYLKLPKHAFVDPHKAKKVKRSMYLFTVLIGVPSIFMAFNMVQESSFNSNAIRFMKDLETNPLLENVQIINSSREYSRKESTISIVLVGKPLAEAQIENLRKKLPEFGLNKTNLIIRQPMDKEITISGELIEDVYKRNMLLTDEITGYKKEISKLQGAIIPNEQLAKEIRIQFENIHTFSISQMIYTNIQTLSTDTIPTAYIVWKNEPSPEEVERLEKWLHVRLNFKRLKLSNTALDRE